MKTREPTSEILITFGSHFRDFRYLGFMIIASLLSCLDQGVPVRTDPETFDIQYWFVNNGDSNIRAVEILSVTWYPRDNASQARTTNFQNPSPFDTLRDTASVKGYVGCTTQLGIYINKAWGVPDSTPCWRFYYLAGQDTVSSYEKRTRIFRWPEDTTIAIQEYPSQAGFCPPTSIANRSRRN